MQLHDQINLVSFLYISLFIYLSLQCFINSSSYFHKYRKSIQKIKYKQYIKLLLSSNYVKKNNLLTITIAAIAIIIWFYLFWSSLKLFGEELIRNNPLILYPGITLILGFYFLIIPLLIKSIYKFIDYIVTIIIYIRDKILWYGGWILYLFRIQIKIPETKDLERFY